MCTILDWIYLATVVSLCRNKGNYRQYDHVSTRISGKKLSGMHQSAAILKIDRALHTHIIIIAFSRDLSLDVVITRENLSSFCAAHMIWSI